MGEKDKKKRLIISKEQYDNYTTLSEARGMIPKNLYQFGQYIVDYMLDSINKKFGINKSKLSNASEEQIHDMLFNHFGEDELVDEYTFNKQAVNGFFGINLFNSCTVFLICTDRMSACFLPTKTTYENDNKANELYFVVDMITLLTKQTGFYETMTHELTHAYQYCSIVMKRGKEYASDRKEYWSTGSPSEMMHETSKEIAWLAYYLSIDETNARIAQLYHTLEANNANEKNALNIAYEKGYISKIVTILEKYKANIEANKKNIVYDLIRASENPYFKNVFPSMKEFNPNKYRKRIVEVIQKRINYIKVKVNRIVKQYLQDRQQKQNNQFNYF